MTRRSVQDWLLSTPVAHRGLHDKHAGVVENSPAAFEAAVSAGYAIELDLQQSSDGDAIVFHDDSLDRLTESEGKICQRSANELRQIQLSHTTDRIPLLSEVLDLVAGRTPLLIEIKNTSRVVGELERRTWELLSNYHGPYAIQSFNPLTLKWFCENAPSILRGQLSTDCRNIRHRNVTWRAKFIMRNLLLFPMSRPDFIGYDINALPAIAPWIARRIGLPILAWTVTNESQHAVSQRYADNIIFEGFEAPLG
jgi:glycerophosphoryl diester phosphodiesterase